VPDFDPGAILEVLERHRVRYVVVGAFAALLQGVGVVTGDLDVTPAADEENLAALAAALTELGGAIRVSAGESVAFWPDARQLARAQVWNLTTRFGDLDLVLAPAAFPQGYEQLAPVAQRVTLADRPVIVAVARLEDVLASKQSAGREKDLASLGLLQAEIERRAADARS